MAYSRGRNYRGYRRHGHGMKGRRGYGLKGGKGNAGLGKHKWIWLNKYYKDHWGSHGFTSHHPSREDIPINLMYLQENLQLFADMGVAKIENGLWYVDLSMANINKLLGSGRVSDKIKVKVAKASKLAKKKLEEAGGGVELNA